MVALLKCPRLSDMHLANARVVPGRRALLDLLPKGGTIVEVGVALGDFSQKLIDVCQPDLFVAIDLFRIHENPSLWGRPTHEIFGGGTHGDFYRATFVDLIEQGKMRVIEETSVNGLESLEDASVDLFYVDAEHSYEAVRGDLAVIARKVKPSGLIIMNDYTMVDVAGGGDAYGVIQATNEFMIAEGWEMLYFSLHPFMYCDVTIRKLPAA